MKSKRAVKAQVQPVVSLGDYVLASKFSDCDPQDPWRVGFVCRIIHTWNRRKNLTYIIGEQDGTWSDFREYGYARKITKEKGKAWLQANDEDKRAGTKNE